uniref:Uncharacterized protein n=1 Tax=Utricularia reniformis TaxID=192314 RepID=A0A1Y0B3W5_9LAMI|nr:hypothetical protein AEK19_MT1983 [Utricularia reniformis]ART32146.1 hypothetical protein AEK19_MT1983 [Utricularia reniformis]
MTGREGRSYSTERFEDARLKERRGWLLFCKLT